MSLSVSHFVAVICLGLHLDMGLASGTECLTTATGYTWEFKSGIDEEFSGVATVDACLKLCEENHECQGYTWASTGIVSYCYIFQELNGIHTCEGCSSGTVPSCNSGACSGSVDDILDQYIAESVQQCAQFCHKTNGCSSFTYYKTSSICFLYSHCKDSVPCSDCSTCTMNCIRTLPDQCYEYMILDEPDRNIHAAGCSSGGECFRDRENLENTSPRWQGLGFYRFMEPAGTQMPESTPEVCHCGTGATGWLNGQHPTALGVEVSMKVCFDWGYVNSRDCENLTDITVTKCNGFFVYQLPDVHGYSGSSSLRYCAAGSN